MDKDEGDSNERDIDYDEMSTEAKHPHEAYFDHVDSRTMINKFDLRCNCTMNEMMSNKTLLSAPCGEMNNWSWEKTFF